MASNKNPPWTFTAARQTQHGRIITMTRILRITLPLIAALFVSAAAPAHAETLKFSGAFASEGAAPSKAKGKLWGTYDTQTRKISYKVTWSGLSGPVKAAHFHGPAGAGQKAGILIPVNGAFKSGMTKSAAVNAKTAKAMLAGRTYLNLHTAANPGGEIRFQVLFAKKPSAYTASADYGSSSNSGGSSY
jgi:hypothetical protein